MADRNPRIFIQTGPTERLGDMSATPGIGLELRDLFAMAALGGIAGALAGMKTELSDHGIIHNDPQSVSELSYLYADTMLAEREKRNG